MGDLIEPLLLDSSEKMLVENNRWYLFKIAALGDLETAQKISAAAIIDASKAFNHIRPVSLSTDGELSANANVSKRPTTCRELFRASE
jgi:hypothetical protein